MNDSKIVDLYWQRDESAIDETASKYGKYCYGIAYNVLHDDEDSKESVNDTYFDAWNCIPPNRPSILSSFLGKITRRISIDKWRKKNADKRGSGQLVEILDELENCIPDNQNVEKSIEQSEMNDFINSFVKELPDTEQKIFVCRYWYMDSVKSISRQFGFSQSKVKSMLFRTREKLRLKLMEEENL